MLEYERTQVDNLQDEYSLATGLDTGEESLTRQEFKQEADINYIVSRFGLGFTNRPPIYGDVDFDLDLQQAYASFGAAQAAHARLPQEVRDKFPTPEEFLKALHTGEYLTYVREQKAKATEAGTGEGPPPTT